MAKSIAEMRASGHVRRPTRDFTICLDSDLADEHAAKRQELVEAVAALEAEKDKPQAPGRLGTREKAAVKAARERVEQLGDELDAIADRMAEFEVLVTVERAETEAWNDWAAEHPPREQPPDELGRRSLIIRDAQHGGRVNFDALIKDLAEWVIALNGAPLADGDWAWVMSKAAPGNVDDLADGVLEMHTGRVSLPKSLKASLATLLDAIDSKRPEPGTSAPAGTTDGNQSGKPSTSTTTTDG